MLKLGALEIDFPIVQAALSGYSDLAMRRVARMHGARYALAEVILDQTLLTRGKKQRAWSHVPADDHPVGAQLLGAEPMQFAAAAERLVEAGYDCVDMNFGCPVRKVLGRGRGGFLLSEPSRALTIVRAVLDAVDGRRPVTVKMRRGLDESAASTRNFFEILDGALSVGVAAVTVHARTVQQRYDGPSDWSFLARVKRHVGSATVLGSGDLFSAADCLRMMTETGVDGVTVARGAIGNPWIFRDARALCAGRPLPEPPGVVEQGQTLRRHFEWSCALHGPERAGRLLRKFGIRYSRLHPCPQPVRDAFIAASTPEDWCNVLERWYDPRRCWPAPVRPTGPGDLVTAGTRPFRCAMGRRNRHDEGEVLPQ